MILYGGGIDLTNRILMMRQNNWENCLGVLHHVGSDLCYWIVTDSGQVVLKTPVEHVTRNDYLNEDTKAKVK
jgi:hypothetical protein